MPADPHRILAFILEIDQTPHDRLMEMDRELLIEIRSKLLQHKREVDRAVLRLALVLERQLS